MTDNPSTKATTIAPAPFNQAVIEPSAFTPADGQLSQQKRSIKPLTIALALLLLVGLTVVWFLFTAKSVIIKTMPATSEYRLEGGIKFEIDNQFVMRQGEYHFSASYPGYYPLDLTLVVDEQQNQVKQLAFKKLPGRLTIVTADNIKAQVWIDDKAIGSSDEILADIAAGQHQLKVSAPRYFDYTGSIDINGMDQHQQLTVTLTPAWADVSLLSEPDGAQLNSGDTFIGRTPFNGTLLQGEHSLTLTLPGHKSWHQTISVTAGQSIDLTRVYLSKLDGILQLTTSPKAVSVTLNGQYQGVTPLELPLIANQQHQLSLFKDGYQQQQQTITVPSGESRQLSLTLAPQLGQVTIHASEEDALLYIDDVLMGRANQSVTLTAKQHKVVIKKQGYVDYQTTVLPRADLQQIVDASLKTLEQAKWESIKPQINTVVGATLKLFKPSGVFTMGASRREQGRRANEVSRRIALKRPFYLGTHEISNSQYRRFARQHSSGHVKGNSLNNDHHPVVNISWQQAVAFCNWLSTQEKLPPFYQVKDNQVVGFNQDSTGYRLPTEAEWAWTTRYNDGQMRKYAWGSKLPPMPNSGNFADRSGAAILGFIQAQYNDKYTVTAPVASFAPNDKGIYDLSGNVAEWMHDYYEVKTGLSRAIERDPLGADKGDYHVIRGSSWAHGTMTELRLSFRDYGIEARNDVGFRVARFVDVKGNEQ